MKKWIFSGVAVIFCFSFWLVAYNGSCQDSSFTITDNIVDFAPDFLDDSIQGLFDKSIGKGDKQIGTWIDERVAFATNLFGYGRGTGQAICLFVYDLGVGFLAGFWIYLIYLLYEFERNFVEKKIGGSDWKVKQFTGEFRENKYLVMVGGSLWKAVVLGFAYAVIMQVPFLTAFLDVIFFDFLADGVWFDVFVRSALVALYFGVGPTVFDQYKRYKLIKAYQYDVLRKKYQSQAEGLQFRT